jgi:hypothetical protein
MGTNQMISPIHFRISTMQWLLPPTISCANKLTWYQFLKPNWQVHYKPRMSSKEMFIILCKELFKFYKPYNSGKFFANQIRYFHKWMFYFY